MASYQPKIIIVKTSPLLLKRKNHSWRPEGKKQILERFGYIMGQTVGEGPHSTIRLAYIQKEENYAAVKIIKKNKIPKETYEKFIKREIYILQRLQHPHIIGLNGVVESTNHLYILMEYASNGDLLEYVNAAGFLPEVEARRLFRQTLAAVKALHETDVVHRDLKLENILLDENYNVKLADFGFSRLQFPNQSCNTFCGSHAYAAPEILDGEAYDGKTADVWALGVCLYGMVHGRLPFHEGDADILRQSMDQAIRIRAGLSQECTKLIRSMLTVNSAERATLAGVIASPWMAMPMVTSQEVAHDDLDSTWSVISREERLCGKDYIVNTTSVCSSSRTYEDPHAPAEHGYNNDQRHTITVPSTTVTDILTAVKLNKGCQAVSSPLTSRTDFGNISGGAAGKRTSQGQSSAPERRDVGQTGKKLSTAVSGYRRRSIVPHVDLGKLSLKPTVGRPGQLTVAKKPSHSHIKKSAKTTSDKRKDELKGLGCSHAARVARYLANERKSNTCLVRKLSVQMAAKTDDAEVVDKASQTVDNFVSKFFVANSR